MKRPISQISYLLALTLAAGCATSEKSAQEEDAQRVYFGTYTGGKSQGIYVCDFDPRMGTLGVPQLAAETKNPSFLALHPNQKFLYAVAEMDSFNGKKGGAVSAFAVDAASGRLTLLNQQSARGGGPCHLVVDAAGKHVLVANYSGGNAAALPIGVDGRLGEATGFVQHQGSSVNPQRQREPHAHSINLDPADRFAFVADLGLDQVRVYRFDRARGALAANDPPTVSVAAGSGPRHFAFHPDGRRAYVINELLSTLTAFSYDPRRGELRETQTLSTLPADFRGNNSTAEVQVHPSGKFVYGSNRGHDSIAIFSVDGAGRLTVVGHEPTQGKTPRNFRVDPSGRFLIAANQQSDSVTVFRIDQETGRLAATGQKVEIGAPVCVKFARR